jgi:hypothetical protein
MLKLTYILEHFLLEKLNLLVDHSMGGACLAQKPILTCAHIILFSDHGWQCIQN